MKFDDRDLFTTNNYGKRGSLSSLVGVTNTNAESVTRNKFFEILVTLKTLATTLTYNVNIISNLRKLKRVATVLTYNVNIISNLRKLKLLVTTLTYNINIISNIEKILSGIKTLATTLTYSITTSNPSILKTKFTGTSLNYNFTITSLAVKLGQLKGLATSLVYNFNLPNNNIIKSKNVSALVETSL